MPKANITELRDNLATHLKAVKRGQTIVITNHGRPIAKLAPIDESSLDATARIEALRESAFVGDVTSPIEAEWEAMRG